MSPCWKGTKHCAGAVFCESDTVNVAAFFLGRTGQFTTQVVALPVPTASPASVFRLRPLRPQPDALHYIICCTGYAFAYGQHMLAMRTKTSCHRHVCSEGIKVARTVSIYTWGGGGLRPPPTPPLLSRQQMLAIKTKKKKHTHTQAKKSDKPKSLKQENPRTLKTLSPGKKRDSARMSAVRESCADH